MFILKQQFQLNVAENEVLLLLKTLHYFLPVWNFGVKKGLKQGRKQGIQQRNYEIAHTALNDGIAPEQVAKITGLSLVAVKKLAEN